MIALRGIVALHAGAFRDSPDRRHANDVPRSPPSILPRAAAVHPAPIARPEEKCGEAPCALVERKPNLSATATEIRACCGEYLTDRKVPKFAVFGPIARSATGKIDNLMLREAAKDITESAS